MGRAIRWLVLAGAVGVIGLSLGAKGYLPVPGRSEPEIRAFLTTWDLAVGPNRLAFALETPDGAGLPDARVRVGFYALAGGPPVFKGAAEARYEALAVGREVRGVYVVPEVVFDGPGPWGAAVEAVGPDGRPARTNLGFAVLERHLAPAVGAPAPAVASPTADSPEGLGAICTHEPPCDLHRVSVAGALAAHRPFVVVFATPAFCRSRICGPVLDLVLGLEPRYRDRVEFIHIEPYELELARQGRLQLGPAARAWGLPSEPWVFVVGADGRIAARLEGIFSAEELEAAIRRVAG